jgi:glycosyltransferase involved in cell wall biosynthesis
VLVDGLALGGLASLAEAQAKRLRLAALVHHPLAEETGLDPGARAFLAAAEARALAAVRGVVVPSRASAAGVAALGVPAERIAVVAPGTDRPGPPTDAANADDGVHLLCVAAVVPRKGHGLLLQALETLAGRPWRLTCAGSLERSPETAQALRRQLGASRIGDRVTLAGAVGEAALDRLYRQAGCVVLASHHEGYGMVLSEALAYGLPVIATRAGAIPEVVPPEAGILVAPGDGAGLAAALARILDDRGLRRALAAGAGRAGRALPSWTEAAARLEHALALAFEEEAAP